MRYVVIDVVIIDRFYVWEIMHSTIKKMSKHVDKLQKDVEDSKDKLEAFKRKVRNLISLFILLQQ